MNVHETTDRLLGSGRMVSTKGQEWSDSQCWSRDLIGEKGNETKGISEMGSLTDENVHYTATADRGEIWYTSTIGSTLDRNYNLICRQIY